MSGGWQKAGSLKPGDFVFDIDGSAPVTVRSIRFENVAEKVYNFEVEGLHNYFVGDEGLLVHNARKDDLKKFDFLMKQIEKRIGRKCSKKDRRRVHDEITKKGYTDQEIIDIGEDLLK